MKEKIKTFFCVLLLMAALPYILTIAFQGKGQEEVSENTEIQETEEYLIGVVAREMPITYEMEALKAQAVIARTNLMAAMEKEEEFPETMSQEELLRLWGNGNFGENYQRAAEAVKETEGTVMTCQGSYIYGAFHAVSAGRTRSAKEALENETMPWLEGVESTGDIPAVDYLKVIFLKKEEFANHIKQGFPEMTVEIGNPLENISIGSRDEAGYVTEMKVGEKVISGEEFRNVMELNSSCFYMKEVEGKIRIVTKGLGHGLGMSQYGANEMALEGADYTEILSYYFKNIEISD